MATVSWYSDFHPILGIEPFIVLGTMLSDKASRFSLLIVQLIVFHCCNQGVEAQAARTGTVGVADRLPLSFREIRYDLGLERRLPASERISSWFSFSKICSNK